MPTNDSNSGRGRQISSPLCSPSNRRSWRGEMVLVFSKNTTVEKHIQASAFSRKALFHTLFTFYYDLLFGIVSALGRQRPNYLPEDIVSIIQEKSDQILHGLLDEELSKVLRGATGNMGSRKLRFDFIKDSAARATAEFLSS